MLSKIINFFERNGSNESSAANNFVKHLNGSWQDKGWQWKNVLLSLDKVGEFTYGVDFSSLRNSVINGNVLDFVQTILGTNLPYNQGCR